MGIKELIGMKSERKIRMQSWDSVTSRKKT